MKYDIKQINNLNKVINKCYPHIFEIEPSFNITYRGISRMVMLDRYSQKDTSYKNFIPGDLVIVIVSDDLKFPTRVIGNISKITKNSAEILIEDGYIPLIKKSDFISKNTIKKRFTRISKPLEIYWEQIAKRVANKLSSVEKSINEKQKWMKSFYSQIKNQKILPAGRVLYGAGSNSMVTYFNCYVLPYVHDSREGISNHRKLVMDIMSRGGGVGTNGSTLRPNGTNAKSVGGKSSGSVSWLNDISNLTNLVEQGGSRRGAQMIMLADWHPDIINFIISKMQKPEILNWLKINSKDPEIRSSAASKIILNPLGETKKVLYEYVKKHQNEFSDEIVEKALNTLEEKGTWIIDDPEFLTGSNISVAISDEFMEAVNKDEKWVLKFPDLDRYTEKEKQEYDEKWADIGDIREWKKMGYKIKNYYTMRARNLWDLICFCATYSAEPGIFFIDVANKDTNAASYGQKVVATNPCGEQPLAPYSVCNLAAINLSKFVNRKNGKILWKELENSVKICTRLQDNVIDATPYFSDKYKKQATGERRVGLGIMGLHDLLIWTNTIYGSTKSLKIANKVMKTIAESAYNESINIAKEKGSFPFLTNREDFIKTGYMKRMKKSITDNILKYGIRNSHLLTIAPTGTTGTLANVSTGLEPFFGYTFYRSGRLGKSIKVESGIVSEYIKYNPNVSVDKLPDVFIKASQLSPMNHAKMQVTIQRWVDSSISKTVNAPSNFTVMDVEKIYSFLHKNNAKGGTVYVDGSRNKQVLSLFKNTKPTKKIEIEDISKEKIKKMKEKSINSEKRFDRLDREIGVAPGNICPNCKEGIMIVNGGCTECNNCKAQLKCGL